MFIFTIKDWDFLLNSAGRKRTSFSSYIYFENMPRHISILYAFFCLCSKKRRQINHILQLVYTANVYRQTTDKLMFKSVISTVR